jgi:ribosome-associated toxin RatA of RatAB toxin-antitoxin module
VPLIALAIGGVSQVHAATESRIESRRHGALVAIHATADLAADCETAWRVLTDYSRYIQFIPGLRESRVTSRNGNTVVVEQAGSATLGSFQIPVEVTFQIQESPYRRLDSRALSGSFRSLDSRGEGSRLSYEGAVRLPFPLFGSLGQSAIEANIARQFKALVDEIERQRDAAPVPSAGEGR